MFISTEWSKRQNYAKEEGFQWFKPIIFEFFSFTFFNLLFLGFYNDEWMGIIVFIVDFYILLLFVPFILLNFIIYFCF